MSAAASRSDEAQSQHLAVAAWQSLCVRFVRVLTDAHATLDSAWVANPWAGRNFTDWITPTFHSAPPSEPGVRNYRTGLPEYLAEIGNFV